MVWVGYDSKNNDLHEPTLVGVEELIRVLELKGLKVLRKTMREARGQEMGPYEEINQLQIQELKRLRKTKWFPKAVQQYKEDTGLDLEEEYRGSFWVTFGEVLLEVVGERLAKTARADKNAA